MTRRVDPNLREVDVSPNSGAYDPGPLDEGVTDYPTAELWQAQATTYDLAVEEFPEGPYGAATNEKRLGKTSPWLEGQMVSGRFRDSNLIRSDRLSAAHESDTDETVDPT
ncbi:hypothetical protein Alches_09240 [Alicyclobacillus hesperidum subsp. aegles]|uniref:hypothetical protein n=1 Tax=Alicyclobacillus hesperidum TaxID=89784 RepID=UPI000719333B|nr:hypothetical protein [Alicyclobacillus hesperidum]KRW92038.1 hypothetical protein SD51_06035 [Alicyclobacillus tengchongensis]GLG00885.1 hypothetical protein Alches_09240 [Alicyclobacillus hesperidum subsp. aegles]